jgi:hypothetical protein
MGCSALRVLAAERRKKQIKSQGIKTITRPASNSSVATFDCIGVCGKKGLVAGFVGQKVCWRCQMYLETLSRRAIPTSTAGLRVRRKALAL